MINKILYDISTEFYKNETAQMNLRKYDAMTKHEGWIVHQGLMILIANKIAEAMLTERFTKLSREDKDTNQRAFYMTKEIIDFLLNPLKGAKKYAAIQQHNQKLGATGRKRPKGA